MSKIDPRLKFLREQTLEDLSELETLGRFSLTVEEVPSPKVKILVHYRGGIEILEANGFEPSTVAGDIASGLIDLDRLDDIADLESVVKIESSRPLTSELDLSVPEINADQIHNTPPGFKGSGVIVGIIDTGIDYTNGCFRKPDGTTRILSIWDQYLSPLGTESHPTSYYYGVEYTKSDIDAALATANPFDVVRHKDHDIIHGHGTHVTGIAAGNGSVAGDGKPAFTYVGVAPEADIIMVSNRITTAALGDSAGTLDAVKYIFDKATSLGKPVVINQSQGDNLGPHDGTSLLEQGIDNLLVGTGKAVVKSAGNAGEDDIHAQGNIAQGQSVDVQFIVPAHDTDTDTIDIWYSGQDRFTISLMVPGGTSTPAVIPSSTQTFNLSNGNIAFIDSVLNDPGNGDNRIYIQLTRGTAPEIEQGTWTLRLNGLTVVNGEFNAWIERGNIIPCFTGPYMNNDRTVSIPGTAYKVITVGSYITRGTNVGDISGFSSKGPTRDGRLKPEIAAPGQRIMSVKANGAGNDWYLYLSGTSMAAPHVAGTIALMLQRDSTLTQSQIKDFLMDTARTDALTGAAPNNTWGHGKLDAKAAFDEIVQGNSLTVNIVGSGTVSKVPNLATYSGEVVQLTATPNSGWNFTGWSGAVTGTTNPVSITMDEDKAVTATFSNCTMAILAVGSTLLPHIDYLRVFRDQIVMKSVFKPHFQRLLDRYYRVSPHVVMKMDKSLWYRNSVKYFLVFPFVFLTKVMATSYRVLFA